MIKITMMRKTYRSLILAAVSCGMMIVFGTLAASAQTVSGSIGDGTAARGASTRGSIVLSLPAGVHVNSIRPNSEYAIPTTITLSAPGAKTSRVMYPRGKNKKFSFSNDSINVYDGTVRFNFILTVPANFSGNTVRVNATVRYQACTDEVCYAPTSKKITLNARVR
jgi:DsbC/DsbD-like thiol-disulfide interchange protein